MRTAKNADTSFDPSIPVANPESEIDDMVYRLSHDLRASVRALQELPVWLAEDLAEAELALPDPAGRHLELIADHAGRIDAILNGMLEYSRVGRMQPITTVNPRQTLDNVLDDLGLGDGARVNTQIDRGNVQMGVDDLHRLFAIPITNAIRFHPKRQPIISITAGPVAERTWAFEFTDNGPGIPEEHRAHVFRPMTKLVSRDVDPGAGMGLAVLKKLADCYHGQVEILTPKSGRGTTVRVELRVN